MSVEEKNKDLMKTLDDAWNSQDWDTFEERHAENVAVFWPGQLNPTRGVRNHRAESMEFFKAFPDNHIVNNLYKILFVNGDYTCSVADFTGTFKRPIKGLDGQIIQPTNRKFQIEFCTVAKWKDGKITEERLFYDLIGVNDSDWGNALKITEMRGKCSLSKKILTRYIVGCCIASF